MSLAASVVSHEDVVNSSGEVITKYIVNVKLASNVSYNISKRYSEFKTLFEILKDMIPADYKFPNKSLFHNSAQATKDRRVRGFDQLLQILLHRKPVPMVMERFLGINERKSKALQIRSKSLALKKNDSIPSALNEQAEDGFGAARYSNGSSNSRDGQFIEHTIVPEPQPAGKEVTYSAEKYELIRSLRKETPHIITSSMKMTSLVYIALVVVRIIDISNSDFYEILVTMCVVSFVVAFLRINYMKYTIAQGKLSDNGNGDDSSSVVTEATTATGASASHTHNTNTLNAASAATPVEASAVLVVEPAPHRSYASVALAAATLVEPSAPPRSRTSSSASSVNNHNTAHTARSSATSTNGSARE